MSNTEKRSPTADAARPENTIQVSDRGSQKSRENNYPKSIREALDDLQKKREKVLNMVDDVRFGEGLIRKFRGLRGTSNWHIDIGCLFDDMNVHVTISDFREMVHVRQWLRKQGFPAPRAVDYGYLGQKVWRYYRKGHTFDLSAHISHEEGSACKYVQVGVKEEPVYELQCNGEKLEAANG